MLPSAPGAPSKQATAAPFTVSEPGVPSAGVGIDLEPPSDPCEGVELIAGYPKSMLFCGHVLLLTFKRSIDSKLDKHNKQLSRCR